MITLKNVSKIYQRSKKQTIAVDNINLNISAGDVFGIIGYSGAGKSSLIRLLNRLEETTSGEVIVGEHNITRSDEKAVLKIRQSIGMIFQHFNLLWSRTVRENIEFPLQISGFDKKRRQQRVIELMELVGLTDKADEDDALFDNMNFVFDKVLVLCITVRLGRVQGDITNIMGIISNIISDLDN